MSKMLYRLDGVSLSVKQEPTIPVNSIVILRGMSVVLQNVDDENVLRGAPRVDYARVYNVIPSGATDWQEAEIIRIAKARGNQTVGYSYDDAGHGWLSDKTAVLWGVRDREIEFRNWFNKYYPGVKLIFEDLPLRKEVEP